LGEKGEVEKRSCAGNPHLQLDSRFRGNDNTPRPFDFAQGGQAWGLTIGGVNPALQLDSRPEKSESPVTARWISGTKVLEISKRFLRAFAGMTTLKEIATAR
jgi:hypothetical protein